MKIYLSLNAEKRVMGYGSTKGGASDVEITISDNHEILQNPFVFKFENNQLIKDTTYQQQLINEYEEYKNKPSIEQKLILIQKAIDDIILGGAL